MTALLDRPDVLRPQRSGLHLSPTTLRVVLGLAVGIQVLKSTPSGWFTQTPWVYTRSAWYVDYRYGFVRRGLGGQLTGQSDIAVQAALFASWAIPLVAIVILLELLVRNWTRSSTFLALLIASSPAVVGELVYGRRSDQFGVLIVVGAGIACLYLRRWLLPVMWSIGLMLAGLCFVHEAILFIWGFAAVPIIFVTGNRAWWSNMRLCIAVLGPALVTVPLILLFGRVTPGVAAQLRVDASLEGPTVFRYLSQGAFESMGEVAIVGIDRHLQQITLGLLLVGLHVLWCRYTMGRLWWTRFTRLDRHTSLAIALLMSASVVIVFATGIDWMRWFCSFITSALLITAFAVLSTRQDRLPAAKLTVPWPAFAVVAYLMTLTPIDWVGPTIPTPDIGALYRLLGI
ncbi:hypothetical protein [Skermania piniformis]|uniref:DUF2029 domain-containing protein n=1 Tax=Skermania pinensis TaxID=39122 RepID=A0ABX8SBN5_9ACTN|nr:hypothetical protein [Skermania piniformis]QXQ13860.1 hypothetical protein KV203_19150 [Skermania piniformis]